MDKAVIIVLVVTLLCLLYIERHECQLTNEDNEPQNITIIAPKYDIKEGTVIIPYGDTLKVSCKSYRPVIWVPYDPWYEWNPTGVNRTEFDADNTFPMYSALLTIENASAGQVGRYYCVHKDSKLHSKDDWKDIISRNDFQSVYVYVNNTNQPIVPVLDNSFTIDNYDNFVVPCKPSYPGVQLELCNILDKYCLTSFNNTEGFHVHKDNFHIQTLTFICKSGSVTSVLKARFKYHIEGPEIERVSDFVVLPFNVTWNVSCVADRPIKWVARDPWYKRDVSRFSSNPYVTENKSKEYGALLIIKEPSARDVGQYFCIYEQNDMQSDEMIYGVRIPSLYVFVNDTQQPIVPISEAFTVSRYDTFVVPCKPSYPSTVVELRDEFNKTYQEQFDPKNGFSVNPRSLKVDVVKFNCSFGSFNQELVFRLDKENQPHNITIIAPNHDIKEGAVVIPYGDTWRVSCKSNRPVIWLPYELWYEWNPTGVNCTEFDADNTDRMYSALLTIENASAGQVGRYYCMHKESSFHHKDHQNYNISNNQSQNGFGHPKELLNQMMNGVQVPSVYVYVHDIQQPIVPISETITVSRYDTFVVPCKPSYPSAVVELRDEFNEIFQNECDPNKGFTVDPPNLKIDLMKFNCSSGSFSQKLMFRFDTNERKQLTSLPHEIIILSPVLLCGCCIVFLVALLYLKKRKYMRDLEAKEWEMLLKGDPNNCSPQMTPKEQVDHLFYAIEYEFAKEKLVLQERLGEGAFGVVWKGKAVGISMKESETTVAVKMVKKKHSKEAIRSLIAELKIMMHLGQHLNVVNLLGAVTNNIVDGELMVIVEYCPFGNLLNFLRKNRTNFIDQLTHQSGCDLSSHSVLQKTSLVGSSISKDAAKKINAEEDNRNRSKQRKSRRNENIYYNVPERKLTSMDLIYWASQIAAGMEYLASHHVLHGDLAARNVLLCDDNVVKICDFGLSRSLYNKEKYMKKNGGDGKAYLPVRWLALESVFDGVFSIHSDVWAYGIVLWELFSLGNVPYPGIDIGPEFYKMLREGLRMECPPFSNQEIYNIMLSCWKVKPDTRPSFRELRNQFNGMLPQEMQDHYLALNEPYLAMNAARTTAVNTGSMPSLGPPEEVAPPVPCVETGSLDYIEMKSPSASFTPPAGYVDMTRSIPAP